MKRAVGVKLAARFLLTAAVPKLTFLRRKIEELHLQLAIFENH